MGLAAKMAAASAPAGAASGFAPPAAQQQQAFQPPPQQQQQQQQYGQQPPQQQQGGGFSNAPPSYDNYAQQGQPGSFQSAPGGFAPPPGPPPAKSNNPFAQDVKTPYGQPPQQGQYGQPPQQQQQYGQPPQQQYGQQQQFNAPSQAPPQHASVAGGVSLSQAAALSILEAAVKDQKIEAFYPPGSLGQLAGQIAKSNALAQVCATWKLPLEIGSDLIKLALFDVVLLVDDSGSMAFEEDGTRIDDLKLILERAAYAASLFDADGIQVRFLNSQVEGNGIRDAQGALALLSQIRYSGLTPLGTSMERKVLEPLVLGPARAGRLQKPVLVIAITDGSPAGEPRDQIVHAVMRANQELQRTRYGPDAISFQFAMVGNDSKAQAFLNELDTHPIVGGLVDCISPFEAEQEEMMRKSGFELTPDLYLVKLLLGAVDSSYDEQDE